MTRKAAGWPEARGPRGPSRAAPGEAGKTLWRRVGPLQAAEGGGRVPEQKRRQADEAPGGRAAPHRHPCCSERAARSWPAAKQKALQASGAGGPSWAAEKAASATAPELSSGTQAMYSSPQLPSSRGTLRRGWPARGPGPAHVAASGRSSRTRRSSAQRGSQARPQSHSRGFPLRFISLKLNKLANIPSSKAEILLLLMSNSVSAERFSRSPTSSARSRLWETSSAVASAGMRSAGPRVRSPRPEQLTRQAAPGAGPQRQGGAHGPQPRPGTPASAPSHRPRPRASARRAGAAGGIVRTAQAWPRTGPEAPSPPGPGDRGSGAARARHGWARGGIRQQLRPVCLRDACSVLRPGSESSAAR